MFRFGTHAKLDEASLGHSGSPEPAPMAGQLSFSAGNHTRGGSFLKKPQKSSVAELSLSQKSFELF
jgi:hypothetical protein